MATPNDHIDMKKSTKATALATSPICCHIAIKSTGPSSSFVYGERIERSVLRLLQRKVYGHRHDDRHRHAVEERRRERPLPDRVERRLIEQRDRAQHLRVLNAAVGPNRRLDDDDALHARGLRDRRIHRLDILDFLRRLDVAANAY